jgi:predicted dehydrogenase
MNKYAVRWGILGLGKIAHKFVSDLIQIPDAQLVAVASRNHQKAIDFSRQYGGPDALGSYEELAAHPEVDIVYVATPHSLHMENSLQCMQRGKGVLCEKPLAVNRTQVEKMIDLARENRVFLMEAMWTRFFPFMKDILLRIDSGELGKIRLVEADFGFNGLNHSKGRLFNPNLAGGALLDVGIYPVFLALVLFGKPTSIQAIAQVEKGIDLLTTVQMHWDHEVFANLHCAINAFTKTEAHIYGEDQSIHVPTRWHESQEYAMYKQGELVRKFDFPQDYRGYAYEIMEANRCIQEGRIESDLMSHQFSLDLITTLDDIRRVIGLKYPFE